MAPQPRRPLSPRLSPSLPPLTFGDHTLDALVANDNLSADTADTDHTASAPSDALAELTFGAPSPVTQERSHTAVRSQTPRPNDTAEPAFASNLVAILATLPSHPPEALDDPSFAPATAPAQPAMAPVSPVSPVPRALAPREPHARPRGLTDTLLDRLPECPRVLGAMPPSVAVGIALVAFFCELGAMVRWVRALFRVWSSLSG